MILLISREAGQTSIFKILDYFDSTCRAVTEFPLLTDEKTKAWEIVYSTFWTQSISLSGIKWRILKLHNPLPLCPCPKHDLFSDRSIQSGTDGLVSLIKLLWIPVMPANTVLFICGLFEGTKGKVVSSVVWGLTPISNGREVRWCTSLPLESTRHHNFPDWQKRPAMDWSKVCFKIISEP